MNHSCSPNCHTRKWNVCGEWKLGIFASGDIKKGEELTYDYQFQVDDVENVDKLAKCLCGSTNCRLFLGFNKKRAVEWKQKQIAEGKLVCSGDEIDGNEERRKRKKKRRKSKKKKSKKKKKTKPKKKRTKNLVIDQTYIDGPRNNNKGNKDLCRDEKVLN